MPTTWSPSKLFSKNASPHEHHIAWLQQIIIPLMSTLLVMFSVEFIEDKPTLFLTVFFISFGFVMLSYGVVKFEPLKTGAGKQAFLKKMLYITINSMMYTLALVVILTQFLLGHDVPYFSFDFETQILSVYMQKVYVTFFVMFVSWVTTFMIAKLVFKQ